MLEKDCIQRVLEWLAENRFTVFIFGRYLAKAETELKEVAPDLQVSPDDTDYTGPIIDDLAIIEARQFRVLKGRPTKEERDQFGADVLAEIIYVSSNRVYLKHQNGKFTYGSVDLGTGWVQDGFGGFAIKGCYLYLLRQFKGWDDPTGKSSEPVVASVPQATERTERPRNPYAPLPKRGRRH